MPENTFSYDLRILVCPQCGGTVEATPKGGLFTCSYCSTSMLLASRMEQAPVSHDDAQPDSEAQRLETLRAQDGQLFLPPPAIRYLMRGGSLAADRLDDALAEWQKARAELIQGPSAPAGERLYFITNLLYQHYLLNKDYLRLRATLETASELYTEPRHIQDARCMLARTAARDGDMKSARDWLALCETKSSDIHMDSDYRFTKAYLVTRQGQWAQVIEALGDSIDDVPIADHYDATAGVLRANAHEMLGDAIKAQLQIQRLMTMPQVGPQILKTCRDVYQKEGIPLCEKTLDSELANHEMLVAKSKNGPLKWLFKFKPWMMVILGGALFGGSFAFNVEAIRGLGAVIGIFGALMFITVFVMKRVLGDVAAYQRILKNGTPGKAAIVQVTPTGLKSNQSTQVNFTVMVEINGREPYETAVKVLVKNDELQHYQPGTILGVRVDPKNPLKIALE